MSDEIGSEDQKGGLPSAIELASSKVPEKWRAKVTRSILEFIGYSEFAPLVAKARENMDTMDGRSIVAKALAQAVADRVKAEPEIVDRAMARFLPEECRKQATLEEIALLTYQEVDEHQIPDDDPTPEWMRRARNFAAEVSSDEAKLLWARVLAGEIKKPGSFSLRALRFLSELDQNVAEAFQEVVNHQLSGNAIYTMKGKWNSGTPYLRMKLLLEAGLVSDSVSQSNRPVTFESSGNAFVHGDKYSLCLTGSSSTPALNVPIVLLSQVGREVLPLLAHADERVTLREIAEELRDKARGQLSKAHIGRKVPYGDQLMILRDEVLWDVGEIPPPVPPTRPARARRR